MTSPFLRSSLMLFLTGCFCVTPRVAFSVAPDALSNPRDELLARCAAGGYQVTPEIVERFLIYSQSQALGELEKEGIKLPTDLLTWVDSNGDARGCVYGVRSHQAARMLKMLHSLRMDLGTETFEKYPQLVLAAAVTQTFDPKNEIDLTVREPVKIEIGGDPRVPVDTKDPNRQLDVNDHIINFLNAHMIEEEVIVGSKKAELSELRYDENGIAIGETTPKRKSDKPQAIERRKRPLIAADVIASRELQLQFNVYMKEKGFDVEIDCSDQVIHWNSRDMVRGDLYKQIKEAYELFKTAYEAKGLLPAGRDPIPTMGERCAYLIRNFEYPLSNEQKKKLNWPRYSLHAPWPTLTLLVHDDQPLREREERWLAFLDQGTIPTYGEYIGSVAQQFDMQSARRLSPYPYTYGSIQMMLKDGGVCGAMANIGTRSHVTMGIPSCTAGQPGHCALIYFMKDPKTEAYQCRGGQYATGGDDKTTPHSPWVFGDVVRQGIDHSGRVRYRTRPMVYHKSIAWAVNQGMESFIHSSVAFRLFHLFDEETRNRTGILLLYSGLKINPYNMLLVDAAQKVAQTPRHQMMVWQQFSNTIERYSTEGESPKEGLYPDFVLNRTFRNMAEMPTPENLDTADTILRFLLDNECTNGAALAKYQIATLGMAVWTKILVDEFQYHLETVRTTAFSENDINANMMSEKITTTFSTFVNAEDRKELAKQLAEAALHREMYFGHRAKLSVHPAMKRIFSTAGEKLRPKLELIESMLVSLEKEIEISVQGERNLEATKALATRLRSAISQVEDEAVRRDWLTRLASHYEGREEFEQTTRGKSRKIVDPCLAEIRKAQSSS